MSTTLRIPLALPSTRVVHIAASGACLTGELSLPVDPTGVIVFSRTNNDAFGGREDAPLAAVLRRHGFATLTFDLLTPDEEMIDAKTRGIHGDLALLARRLIDTIDWLGVQATTAELPIGLVGEGAGAAAAFVAACVRPDRIVALVSRSENPDHAAPVLGRVHAPALLIVPNDGALAMRANESTYRDLRGTKELVRYNAGPDAADELSRLVLAWFTTHLPAEPLIGEPLGQLLC
jgi:putative phosphoribosyl transferase